MVKKVTIVGGHGNVALRLTRILSQSPHDYAVTSIVRDPSQTSEITSAGATPLVLSLEVSPVADFTTAFQDQEIIVFSAGAGVKDGGERTKKVDYEGAIKVFDAIEGVDGNRKPRLIMVSAVDLRDEGKVPEHYNDQDKAISDRIRRAIPAYMKWKYEADKDLVQRTVFKWTILRLGGLTNAPGTGKASIGRTHLSPPISVSEAHASALQGYKADSGTIKRDDVANALALLVDREDTGGFGIDLVGGEVPIKGGLDLFVQKGETDFLG